MASVYEGVTINNLRQAFAYLYFGVPEDAAAWERTMKYVLPMQHNFMNPIEVESDDTYILVTYDEDEKLTQDRMSNATNFNHKMARCSVRFIGAQAEIWAKRFHHIDEYAEAYKIFLGTCQGTVLPFIGSIHPVNASFFGKNFSLAFDMEFVLEYNESVDMLWSKLESVNIPAGIIVQ